MSSTPTFERRTTFVKRREKTTLKVELYSSSEIFTEFRTTPVSHGTEHKKRQQNNKTSYETSNDIEQ